MFDLNYESHQYRASRPGQMGTSLQQFHSLFPDEGACFDHVFARRYGMSFPCPKCAKPGKWYRISGLRRMQHPCGYAVRPLAGTVFHNTRIPLHLWFYAMLHFANSYEGVDSPFLSRHLGISLKAAFNLALRIRLHLASCEVDCRLGGEGRSVEVRLQRLGFVRRPTGDGRPTNLLLFTDGSAVTGMVIGKARRHVLAHAIKTCTLIGSNVFTICPDTYRISAESFTRKPIVNYSIEKCDVGCNGRDCIFSFLAYFQRPMRHHHRRVDQKYLWLYLAEFLYKFNRRGRADCTFAEMISQFSTINDESRAEIERRFSRLPLLARGIR